MTAADRVPAAALSCSARIQPILLALAFVILLAVMALDVWFTTRVEMDSEEVERSLQIQYKLANLRLLLRRAESRQRGYLLTNEARYLTSYEDDIKAIPLAIDDLAAAIASNPLQRASFETLQPTINAKLDEMRDTIDLQQAGDVAGASALVRTGRGRNLMEESSDLIGRMEAEEQRLLNLRRASSESSNRWLLLITIAGTAAVVALAAASVLLLRRSLKAQQDAYRALEATNRNLEATVEERTAHLREANEEIQRFAYIVSHDLRSPLVNIMGFTSELDNWQKQVFERIEALRAQVEGEDGAGDEALRGEAEEALGFIKSSIAKMDRLIGAVLKLSREGQRQFQPQSVDVARLLQSISEAIGASGAGR